jgi:hypothetical protein
MLTSSLSTTTGIAAVLEARRAWNDCSCASYLSVSSTRMAPTCSSPVAGVRLSQGGPVVAVFTMGWAICQLQLAS